MAEIGNNVVWAFFVGVASKGVFSARKQLREQLPEGCFGLTKGNNIGTFEWIVYDYRGNNTFVVQENSG